MVRAPVQEWVGVVIIIKEAGGLVRHQDLLLGEVVVRCVQPLIREHRMHALI